MSVDIPEATLSKEEKKARKEEKRKRKEAKAAKAASASGQNSTVASSTVTSAGPSSPVTTSVVAASTGDQEITGKREKKDKKDKKRKRDIEQSATPAASNEVSVEPMSEVVQGESKKSKKDKKDKKDKKSKDTVPVASTAPVSTPVPNANIPQPTTFDSSAEKYLSTHGITITPPIYAPIQSIASGLPVHTSILKWLTKFTDPTPIQACAWPALLAGRDVVGVAETGSGKTLSFGVPGVHLLSSKPSPASTGSKNKKSGSGQIRLLVLAPTRELALQSHETLEELGQAKGLTKVGSVCIYGGVGKDEQIKSIRNPSTAMVVGTPGRVLDLADSGDLDLSGVTYLVLDEADRMLDQGFENDIRRIFAHCPGKENRQTVMFSATWPESVRRLASTFLRDPIRITVGSDELSANKRIEQIVEVLDNSRLKDSRMIHHLRTHLKEHPSTPAHPTRILVFALYKKEAMRLEGTIRRNFSVAGLHGDMGQVERFKALDKFKKGEVNVLVATDVAARGLDIPDVGLVLNVTFPLTTEDFVHRCGRTGRAGKSGKAVTFFTGESHERSLAGEFMRVLRDVGAEVPKEMDRFPTTIKKKEHGAYGAFYKDTSNAPAPVKITFD